MYKPKNFNQLLGIQGLSDELLKNHFSLYEGYIKNVNLMMEALDKKPGSVEYSELQRRFGWEFNGMRLHELYFGNLNKKQKSLEKGDKPEQAREMLPHAIKVEIVVTANLREWRHIFDLRCSKKAHPQMRALMLDCLQGFAKEIPLVFDSFM